jgi:lipoprotein-releasing system permease protein
MNISLFLAKKIEKTKSQTFSSLIITVGVISISIAVSVLIISFFVLFGFKNTIKEKLFSITSHLQVSKFTVNRSLEEATVPNNLQIVDLVKKNPKIKSINKAAYKSIILKSEEEISGVVFKGIDQDYDWKEFSPNIVSGRPVRFQLNGISNELIISEKIALELNLTLNDELLIYFIQNPPRARKLKIVGIYASNVEEMDQIYVLGDLALIQKINNWEKGEFGHYEIFIKDINQLDLVKTELLDVFSQEYQVLKVTEILPMFFDWFKLLDKNIVIVIILIVLVASFNMISVLLIMIMERTPMIGLLKAVGSLNSQIRAIFIFNGAKIIFKGLIIGNLLGLGLCYLQDKFKIIKLDASNYYMNFVPINWNWPIVLLINLAVFVVVLVVLMIPSLIITRISPVQALKYKD